MESFGSSRDARSPVAFLLEVVVFFDVEIVVFGLAPLLLPSHWVGRVMVLGAVFYLVADLVNTRRLWRMTRAPHAHSDRGMGTT